MPTFDIRFRQDPTGGALDLARAQEDARRLRGHPHLALLIHGYNNTLADAQRAYRAFVDNQQQLVDDGSDWAGEATVVNVFWPGDARWGFLAPAYYPWAVSRAQDVAGVLAAMFIDWAAYARNLQIDFVAHSLGNRVLLRALALASRAADLRIRRVVHMAAAVPTWKLVDPGDPDGLRDGLAKETRDGAHALSLFSCNDSVLSAAFPLGETLSPESDGFFPTALGHESWAAGLNNHGLSQREAQGAGHGDYWGAEQGTSEYLRYWVSREIATELALTTPAIRDTMGRMTPPGRETGSRETGVARSEGRLPGADSGA